MGDKHGSEASQNLRGGGRARHGLEGCRGSQHHAARAVAADRKPRARVRLPAVRALRPPPAAYAARRAAAGGLPQHPGARRFALRTRAGAAARRHQGAEGRGLGADNRGDLSDLPALPCRAHPGRARRAGRGRLRRASQPARTRRRSLRDQRHQHHAGGRQSLRQLRNAAVPDDCGFRRDRSRSAIGEAVGHPPDLRASAAAAEPQLRDAQRVRRRLPGRRRQAEHLRRKRRAARAAAIRRGRARGCDHSRRSCSATSASSASAA